MRQPEDNKTQDLLKQPKRGRGRPRIENPLTPAERARRYRERRATEGRTRPSVMRIIRDDEEVTEMPPGYGSYLCPIHGCNCNRDTCFDQTVQELNSYREGSLGRELEKANRRIFDLTGALDEVVKVAAAGKRIPAHMLKGLMKLLADA